MVSDGKVLLGRKYEGGTAAWCVNVNIPSLHVTQSVVPLLYICISVLFVPPPLIARAEDPLGGVDGQGGQTGGQGV